MNARNRRQQKGGGCWGITVKTIIVMAAGNKKKNKNENKEHFYTFCQKGSGITTKTTLDNNVNHTLS